MCVCVCVIANEALHGLIWGCQLRQVSLARDGASWAVSCPGFSRASPGQGRVRGQRWAAGLGWALPPPAVGAHGAPRVRRCCGVGTGQLPPYHLLAFFPFSISHSPCLAVRWQRASEPLISHFRDLALLMA